MRLAQHPAVLRWRSARTGKIAGGRAQAVRLRQSGLGTVRIWLDWAVAGQNARDRVALTRLKINSGNGFKMIVHTSDRDRAVIGGLTDP